MLDNGDSEKLHRLHAAARVTFVSQYSECNDNYKDANTLHRFPMLKPNPKMKRELDNMAVLGSSILSLIRFGTLLLENNIEEEMFREGSEARLALQTILKGLDIEDDTNKTSGYHINKQASGRKAHHRPNVLCTSLQRGERLVPVDVTFAHLCEYICNYIMHRENQLDNIQWGFVGKRRTSKGRRTTLSGPLLTTR